MSGYATAAALIRARLATYAGTISWSAFNGLAQDSPDGRWIRPAILWGPANRATLGPNARRRRWGTVVVQVFEDGGQDQASTVLADADVVCGLLRDYQVDSGGVSLRFLKEPNLRFIGLDSRQTYQVNVEAEFYFDEVL